MINTTDVYPRTACRILCGNALLMLLASCFFAPVITSSASGAEAIGHVVALEGEALAFRNEGEKVSLAVKSPVYMMDTIKTSAKGKLQLLFTDDSMLAQGPSGELKIDEYVFEPADKKKCGMGISLMKGVFRSVTGKITALNPERFKVKTRMATIGIRGCDVGFDVQPGGENVLVFELTDNQDVIVTFDAPPGAGPGNPPLPPATPAVGRIVTITPDGRLRTRNMTPAEVQRLVLGTSPALNDPPPDQNPPPGGSGPGGTPQPGSDPGAPVTQPAGSIPPPTDGSLPPTPPPPAPDGTPFLSDAPPLPLDSDPVLDGGFDAAALDSGVYQNTLFVEDPLTLPPPPADPPPADDPPPPPADDPLPPPPPPPPLDGYYTQAAGNNWEWGLWYIGGVLDDIEHSNFNPVPDAAAIIAGGTTYTLSGTGPAGAIVEEAGVPVGYMSGQVNIAMTIGNANDTCNISLSLSDGVNMATISALANINGAGQFSVLYSDITPYGLTWNAVSYTPGDIAMASWIDGSLVGPGTAVPAQPITGVVGGFDIIHNPANSPVLIGEFGADVN